MDPIILAIIVVTVIGLIGAVILVAASIFMYVPVDERVEKITAVLAGANCGACGCAGCADYAKSIVEDGNAINKCTPGGAKSLAAIAEIMGVEAGSATPMKAVVACSGTCEKTSKRYEFEGIHSCQAVKGLYGGDGMCKYGCLGYGDCTRACAFDAIHIVDGSLRWTVRSVWAVAPVPLSAPMRSSLSSPSISVSPWSCARIRIRAPIPGRPVLPAVSAA